MGTIKHIILAQSEITARALSEYLTLALPECCRGDRSFEDAVNRNIDTAEPILVWRNESLGIDAYRFLAAKLEEAASRDGRVQLNGVIVLVDQVDFRRLNPIAESGWNHVLAMLILTFPEFRWIFGAAGAGDQKSQKLSERHSLVSLFQPPHDPLFDGAALREWVRQRAREHKDSAGNSEAAYLPIRSKVAIAIDDERNYAYFHGYAAYRYGFLAYPVTEESLMLTLLVSRACCDDSLRVTIEDLYLNFPDRLSVNCDTHWSDLDERSRKLTRLDSNKDTLRVFVTAGQNEGTPEARRKSNRQHQLRLRKAGRLGKVLFKPISGIFDLWQKAGLKGKLRGGHQRGQAEGFMWPPVASDHIGSENHAHSAPGRLLEIAGNLIARAERMLPSAQSVGEATQGAVLALDALELLGERAQTTFGQALALKHQFEAVAECQFYGVQSHFDVKSRMADVQVEVHGLGRHFNPKIRKEAEWNVEAAVLSSLIRTYRVYNQFDEEQALQTRSRAVHRRLWFKKIFRFWGDQLRWANPLYWVACYVNGLLRSLPIFLFALVAWVGILGWLFASTGNGLTTAQGYQDAVTSFFSVGGPIHHDAPLRRNDAAARPSNQQLSVPTVKSDPNDIQTRLQVIQGHIERMRLDADQSSKSMSYVFIVCLAIIAGFVHLGIFISHLYTVVSRR